MTVQAVKLLYCPGLKAVEAEDLLVASLLAELCLELLDSCLHLRYLAN